MPILGDSETGTLWSPFTGVALAGVLRGTILERLPLLQCLWSEWRAMHPATLTVYADQSMRLGPDSAHSPGSPGIGARLLQSLVRPIDARLPHNTLVFGVEKGPNARAYPLQSLARIGPVLNDFLGGSDIVVRCQPGTLQALAFDRHVGDRPLVFRSSATAQVYDEQTQSLWSEMGEAVSGPLAGIQLRYIDSGVEEWYAFAADHPNAEIFESR
jgi:hypothetical protein